jgi:hypothetical protein
VKSRLTQVKTCIKHQICNKLKLICNNCFFNFCFVFFFFFFFTCLCVCQFMSFNTFN